jgi:hypothetical protein
MNITREKEAISAYLKLLQTKGAVTHLLYEHSLFLDKFAEKLAGKALGRAGFSAALDAVMETIPTDDWHISLNIAREFYPFWMKDIKTIANFNLHYGFDVDSIQWKPLATSLKSLMDSLDKVELEDVEIYPLYAYQLALRHNGAEKTLVDTCVKLAKIILLRLRDAPVKNNKTYRTAVDVTLPLFRIKETKQFFLIVVREFYNFWSENPDAANMVLKYSPENLL